MMIAIQRNVLISGCSIPPSRTRPYLENASPSATPNVARSRTCQKGPKYLTENANAMSTSLDTKSMSISAATMNRNINPPLVRKTGISSFVGATCGDFVGATCGDMLEDGCMLI